MTTSVIHIRNRRNTPDEVYIGRPSIYGNPYVIGRDGTRAQVIERFEHITTIAFMVSPARRAEIRALRGKTLVCYCKPAACHGDILAALADR